MHKHLQKHLSKEQLQVHGENIYHKVNELAREAHKSHVSVHNRKRRHLISFPMTLGIAAALVLPVAVALGLAAYLMNDWHVSVEKREEE